MNEVFDQKHHNEFAAYCSLRYDLEEHQAWKESLNDFTKSLQIKGFNRARDTELYYPIERSMMPFADVATETLRTPVPLQHSRHQ